MRGSKEARTTSKYGLRGTRVGEASNPGPPPITQTPERNVEQWPFSSCRLVRRGAIGSSQHGQGRVGQIR